MINFNQEEEQGECGLQLGEHDLYVINYPLMYIKSISIGGHFNGKGEYQFVLEIKFETQEICNQFCNSHQYPASESPGLQLFESACHSYKLVECLEHLFDRETPTDEIYSQLEGLFHCKFKRKIKSSAVPNISEASPELKVHSNTQVNSTDYPWLAFFVSRWHLVYDEMLPGEVLNDDSRPEENHTYSPK